MYCLNQDLTRTRRTYRPLLPTLPSICVIWVPSVFQRRELGLGRFFPVILETDAEEEEFEALLAAPRSAPVPPNFLNLRASQLVASSATLATYFAPEPGWPHILLLHAPIESTWNADPSHFMRQSYIVDMFATEAALAHAAAEMTAAAGDVPVTVVTLNRSWLSWGSA